MRLKLMEADEDRSSPGIKTTGVFFVGPIDGREYGGPTGHLVAACYTLRTGQKTVLIAN